MMFVQRADHRRNRAATHDDYIASYYVRTLFDTVLPSSFIHTTMLLFHLSTGLSLFSIDCFQGFWRQTIGMRDRS